MLKSCLKAQATLEENTATWNSPQFKPRPLLSEMAEQFNLNYVKGYLGTWQRFIREVQFKIAPPDYVSLCNSHAVSIDLIKSQIDNYLETGAVPETSVYKEYQKKEQNQQRKKEKQSKKRKDISSSSLSSMEKSPVNVRDAESSASKIGIEDVYDLIKKCHSESMKAITDSSSKSYAAVVSSPAKNDARQTHKEANTVAFVVEKNSNGMPLPGSTVKKTLQLLPSIRDGNVGVNSIAKPNHVVCVVRDVVQAAFLQKDLNDENYKFRQLARRMPRIKIIGVETTMTDENFISSLKRKNEEFNHDEVKVVGSRKSLRSKLWKSVIVEVPHHVAETIPKSGRKVYVCERRLIAVLDDPLVQCWNCRKFGHTTVTCRAESRKDSNETLCPRCGKVHGKNVVCKDLCCSNCKAENDKKKKGSNLLDTKHSSNNFKDCHVAKKLRGVLLARIFGDPTCGIPLRPR